MRVLPKLAALFACNCLLTGIASASLSGTVVSAQDPRTEVGPMYWYVIGYEPMNNSIAIQSNQVAINLAAWVYANYPDAYWHVRVKINGSTYVESYGEIPTAKQLTPNVIMNWPIPESAFTVGTNTLEYELFYSQKEEGTDSSFKYVLQVNRS